MDEPRHDGCVVAQTVADGVQTDRVGGNPRGQFTPLFSLTREAGQARECGTEDRGGVPSLPHTRPLTGIVQDVTECPGDPLEPQGEAEPWA